MYLTSIEIEKFQQKMLTWYKGNGRSFPWRQTSDPYEILISEFLLQKTHVRKVVEIYPLVLSKFPSVKILADGQVEDLKQIIQPLGFLNRAERLINLAGELVNNYSCEIPQSLDALLAFKGVGRYIATAVLIFAFGECRVVVDTNVIRVFANELGIISNATRPRTDMKLWDFAQTLAPKTSIKEFNWALLDYGAIVSKK